MTSKPKHFLTTILIAIVVLTINNDVKSQGLFDRAKAKLEAKLKEEKERKQKELEAKLNKKVDTKVDEVLDGKKKTDEGSNNGNSEKSNSVGRPKLSELKESDFAQNEPNPVYNAENTRFQIARNLLIDIKGKYPSTYLPKWRFISYASPIKFKIEDWLKPKTNSNLDDRYIWIGDYKGKAVIRFKAHFNCECFAEIMIKDSFSVISSTPKTFELKNFTSILNDMASGQPCVGGLYPQKDGGKGGKITLMSNDNGDLQVSLMFEYYTLPEKGKTFFNTKTKTNETKEDIPSQVHYRYIANNVLADNEMSAEKANAIVKAEQEAKQMQKDYIAKTTKQADSLQKILAKKYPQKDCRNCFSKNSNSSLKVTPTTTVYTNGYGDVVGSSSGSDWDINTKTEIKNKCGYDLTFIGLKQMYDEEKGYYLMEVNKIMEKGYDYRSDQGAMASIFSSLIGGGSEFNIVVQDKYYPNYATVGAVQWLKVVKK